MHLRHRARAIQTRDVVAEPPCPSSRDVLVSSSRRAERPSMRSADGFHEVPAKHRRAAASRNVSTRRLWSCARAMSLSISAVETAGTVQRLRHSASFPVIPTTRVSSSRTSLNGERSLRRPFGFKRAIVSPASAAASLRRFRPTSRCFIRRSRVPRSSAISVAMVASSLFPSSIRDAARLASRVPAMAAA